MNAVMFGYRAAGQPTDERGDGARLPLTGETWLKVTAELSPKVADTTAIAPWVAIDGVPEGGCILVDDVRVFIAQ